jgi:hypothetical protein
MAQFAPVTDVYHTQDERLINSESLLHIGGSAPETKLTGRKAACRNAS